MTDFAGVVQELTAAVPALQLKVSRRLVGGWLFRVTALAFKGLRRGRDCMLGSGSSTDIGICGGLSKRADNHSQYTYLIARLLKLGTRKLAARVVRRQESLVTGNSFLKSIYNPMQSIIQNLLAAQHCIKSGYYSVIVTHNNEGRDVKNKGE